MDKYGVGDRVTSQAHSGFFPNESGIVEFVGEGYYFVKLDINQSTFLFYDYEIEGSNYDNDLSQMTKEQLMGQVMHLRKELGKQE